MFKFIDNLSFKLPQITKTKKIIIGLVLLSISAISIAGYSFYQYINARREFEVALNDPNALQKANQKELQKLLAEIGKFMKLPSDEEPSVVIISDLDKLKGQAFFQNAKIGDKLLLYTKAKKAILYDPVAKVIVDVAPLSVNDTATPMPQVAGAETESRSPEPSPTESPSPSPTPKASPEPNPTPSF